MHLSGVGEQDDVRLWHLADILPADLDVRLADIPRTEACVRL
jgi:hypothetical protein